MKRTKEEIERMKKEVHLCACGCGERIEWKEHHKYDGWAKFRMGHYNKQQEVRKILHNLKIGKPNHKIRKEIHISDDWYMEYMIGALQGDGTLGSYGKMSFCVGIKDFGYAKILINIIKCGTGIEPRLRKVCSGTSNAYNIDVSSANLFDIVKHYKVNSVWKIPTPLKFSDYWIAACFDTDGCVKKYGTVSISQRIESNIELVAKELNKLGIYDFTVHSYETNWVYKGEKIMSEITELAIGAKKDLLKFYEKIPMMHPRKVERINKLYHIVKNRNDYTKGKTYYWIEPLKKLFEKKTVLSTSEMSSILNTGVGIYRRLQTNWGKKHIKKVSRGRWIYVE